MHSAASYTAGLNRFRTRFWAAELITVFGLSLADIERILGRQEPSALAYKWKSGRVGARRSSVKTISDTVAGSSKAYFVALFDVLGLNVSKARLKKIVEDEQATLPRYATLNQLARSIAYFRLHATNCSVDSLEFLLRDIALDLRALAASHEWFGTNFFPLSEFIEKVIVDAQRSETCFLLHWDRLYTLIVDDSLFFNQIEDLASPAHGRLIAATTRERQVEDIVIMEVRGRSLGDWMKFEDR